MGNVLYAIVTSYLPYTYPRLYTEEEFRQMIINGTKPTLPERIENSQHPVNRVIVRAMKKCFTYNPSHRPSAREIAQELQNAYDMLYASSI
jgi:serine/threonine protein kinase